MLPRSCLGPDDSWRLVYSKHGLGRCGGHQKFFFCTAPEFCHSTFRYLPYPFSLLSRHPSLLLSHCTCTAQLHFIRMVYSLTSDHALSPQSSHTINGNTNLFTGSKELTAFFHFGLFQFSLFFTLLSFFPIFQTSRPKPGQGLQSKHGFRLCLKRDIQQFIINYSGAAWPTGRPGNFPVGPNDFLPGGPHLTLEF